MVLPDGISTKMESMQLPGLFVSVKKEVKAHLLTYTESELYPGIAPPPPFVVTIATFTHRLTCSQFTLLEQTGIPREQCGGKA